MIEIKGAYDGTAWPQENLLKEKVLFNTRRELEELRKRLEIKHGCKNIVFIYKNTKKEE